MEPVVMDVVKQHYFEVLRPPKQWNYHCDLSYTAYMASQELAHLEFRDHETKEIANKASYKMFCSAMKDSLKKNLQSKFPAYDTEKLEDGFEETKYTYDKKRCTITVSVLLENIMEPDEAYNW
ncbi:MAG TPA: hypothetical protein PK537_06055 [Candidatus Limiplasma sp.]|nr:hypothetical protein [Candidatus Limiplasma sp.]